MRGKNGAEESGSDWDSMSDGETNKPSTTGIPSAAPRKKKSESVNDEMPPFNFKNEVTTSPQGVFTSVKPGKSNKGNLYDPGEEIQKKVSFSSETVQKKVNGMSDQTDSDPDPTHSSLQEKSRAVEKALRKKSRGNSSYLGQTILSADDNNMSGQHNLAFNDDDFESVDLSLPNNGLPLNSLQKGTIKTSPHGYKSTGLPQIATTFETDIKDSPPKMALYADECPPPYILTLTDPIVTEITKKPLDATNRILAEVFSVVTLPFSFVVILFQHILRFALMGIIKPMFVDSLTLIVEFLVRPFMNGVVKPFCFSIHGVAVMATDVILVCCRPIISILKSVRLVDIHLTQKYSLENADEF